MDHPIRGDDRGTVMMLDLQGNKHALTPEWAGEEGLAWSPNGSEVWFTATDAHGMHHVALSRTTSQNQ